MNLDKKTNKHIKRNFQTERHPYHFVNRSPWPFYTSITVGTMLMSSVAYLHFYTFGLIFFQLNFILLLLCLTSWWSNVILESTYEGHHTLAIQNNIKTAMILFILSEVCFFFAFFWSFFHVSVFPSIFIGGTWPPFGVVTPNIWLIPLLNTFLLIFSGITLTWAHHAIIERNRIESIAGFILTIVAGTLFLGLQYFEYTETTFTISSSVFGSIFFLLTGFHGMHVLIGLTFIIICFIRHIQYHFTSSHHVGFEVAAWYWHFVDVVWIGLFLSLYWWGGSSYNDNGDLISPHLYIEDVQLYEHSQDSFQNLKTTFVNKGLSDDYTNAKNMEELRKATYPTIVSIAK